MKTKHQQGFPGGTHSAGREDHTTHILFLTPDSQSLLQHLLPAGADVAFMLVLSGRMAY
ncbi:MAG: hypothetical protein QF614_02255 [SAR324 cluster bacterium]|nr:hypothetical protein [SAR324 cluster bacterium]